VNCFLVHYQFETIHPFSDGNGRVGRLLLAIMLKEFCRLSKPWLYLSEYYEKHRDEYARRLFNVSAKGDWNAWIEFCLTGTVQQARNTILRCDRLRAMKDSFLKRTQEAGGSIRLTRIVEDIFYSPFVRIAELARKLQVTYPTAQADVERLTQAGILQELANMSPKTYYSPEVFGTAYEELE
jgi:Fic family protein